MKMIQTPAEKKSFAITLSVFIALFLFIFLYKFKSTISTLEMNTGGEIAIRFGQNTQGSGPIQPPKEVAMEEAVSKQITQPKVAEQKVVTQKNTPTDVTIKKVEKTEKKKEKVVEKKAEKEVKKPNASTTNTLDSFLAGKKQKGEKTNGSGDSSVAGNQGAANGSLYSNSYYGSGTGGQGFGGGSSWGLNGRQLATYNTFKPDCNETGTVVIQVTVNNSGKVVATKLNLSGTTNSAPCLVDAATKTARSFRWKADANAPSTQIGFVKIKFNVGG